MRQVEQYRIFENRGKWSVECRESERFCGKSGYYTLEDARYALRMRLFGDELPTPEESATRWIE